LVVDEMLVSGTLDQSKSGLRASSQIAALSAWKTAISSSLILVTVELVFAIMPSSFVIAAPMIWIGLRAD
jgi:hypothetical protein